MGTVFLLGGALMGTAPHHHGPAANSLVYGTKLWFLTPPGQEQVAMGQNSNRTPSEHPIQSPLKSRLKWVVHLP